jgi:PAS domain S-box-containing protein
MAPAVAESKQFFSMVENLPAGAIFFGKGEFFLNQAACEIIGYGPGELISLDDWFATLFPSREEETRRAFQENRAAAPRTLDTLPFRHKDGSERHLEFAVHALDEHEIWFINDVTDRKAAEIAIARNEKALRESEYRIKAILDTAAVAIFTIDSAGIVLQVNRAAETLFGYRREELEGQNISILMPSPHRERHDSYLRRYLETGEARIIGIGREVMALRRDGTLFPAELSVSQSDHLGLFTGILRDITERKKREEELLERQELTERLIETSIHLVLLLDASGRVMRFNTAIARLTGWTQEEAAGQDWFALMAAPRVRKAMQRRFLSTIEPDSRPLHGEIWPIISRTGEERAIEWNVGPINDTRNLVCTGADVTRRLQLEREVVAAAEEERRRTARDLHDGIGSMLTGIQFYVSGARQDPSPENFSKIAELLSDATAQLRAISRGLQPIGPEPDDLMKALAGLARLIDEKSGSKVVLRCQVPIAVPGIDVANHLFRIAQEAVANAIRHSGASRIVIGWRRSTPTAEVVLSITDNGAGFPADGKMGTQETRGLGLHTMRYRAQLVGGVLEIAPRPRGGTRVTCRLPETALAAIPAK